MAMDEFPDSFLIISLTFLFNLLARSARIYDGKFSIIGWALANTNFILILIQSIKSSLKDCLYQTLEILYQSHQYLHLSNSNHLHFHYSLLLAQDEMSLEL